MTITEGQAELLGELFSRDELGPHLGPLAARCVRDIGVEPNELLPALIRELRAARELAAELRRRADLGLGTTLQPRCHATKLLIAYESARDGTP